MYTFLIPLVLGFSANLASAFTNWFSLRFGPRRGSLITALLRNLLGIPVWVFGLGLAILEPSALLIAPEPGFIIIGWIFIALGGIIIVVALTSIRWRAVVPSRRDTIVQDRLYAIIRHPIHAGTLLEFVGLFLLKPTQTFTLACASGILWLFVQSRLEEIDLLQRNPDYAGYMQRVPAFWPRHRWSKKG